MKHERGDKQYTSIDKTDLGTQALGGGQVRHVEVRNDESGDRVTTTSTGGYDKAVEQGIEKLNERETERRSP